MVKVIRPNWLKVLLIFLGFILCLTFIFAVVGIPLIRDVANDEDIVIGGE
jgi:cell division protein FtsB